jgi:polygalacturonase
MSLALIIAASSSFAANSELWGANGERWTPYSRLPDFSHAGYHCGDQAIPDAPPGVSVKNFGAKGDGIADDTAAFVTALATITNGALEVPPGRYRITNILEITRSGVVLRGAGPDKSILFFPTPLQDIKPRWDSTTGGQRTSYYSWYGGLVWFKGDLRRNTIAAITSPARRVRWGHI